MTNQAIVRKITTVVATFTNKPSTETIKALKEAGAEYKNGQWVRSVPEGVNVDEKDAAKVFAA